MSKAPINPDEAPVNEDVQTIGEDWAEGDLPRVEFDDLRTIPILITHADVTESKQEGREGSLWGRFDGVLLGVSRRGLRLKGQAEVIDAEVGTKFTASSGARRVTAVLQRMAAQGFKLGYVVIPSNVEGDKSGNARMLKAVPNDEAQALIAKLPADLEDAAEPGE